MTSSCSQAESEAGGLGALVSYDVGGSRLSRAPFLPADSRQCQESWLLESHSWSNGSAAVHTALWSLDVPILVQSLQV